ncbi:ARM repeat superfamily protein [Actinidia rufa]|uniref:ARM repeat superfamily protein n=1 Tax=Actinidia rufa TaxID=165716 RepID=A0A7J0DDS4_9ERIC|nr:ARM repeat superfamily protein [Actinidia rufa]
MEPHGPHQHLEGISISTLCKIDNCLVRSRHRHPPSGPKEECGLEARGKAYSDRLGPQLSMKVCCAGYGLAQRKCLDSAAVALLVGILKTSSPDLQRKAASILEFATDSDQSIDKIISADIECGLDAVFPTKSSTGELERDQQPELLALKVEEAGLAISAASRLLTRLLDFESFRSTTNPARFVESLRKILRSSIPLDNKDWVAACLVKLSSFSRPGLYFENPMNIEATLHETIPRLIEQIKSSSPEAQEVAVLELNEIISEGVVDCTRAVAAEGGIFPLVKLIEDGTSTAVEAGLAVLYNLSMITENHSTIVAAGAFPALERIVQSERPESMRAIHLLRALPT